MFTFRQWLHNQLIAAWLRLQLLICYRLCTMTCSYIYQDMGIFLQSIRWPVAPIIIVLWWFYTPKSQVQCSQHIVENVACSALLSELIATLGLDHARFTYSYQTEQIASVYTLFPQEGARYAEYIQPKVHLCVHPQLKELGMEFYTWVIAHELAHVYYHDALVKTYILDVLFCCFIMCFSPVLFSLASLLLYVFCCITLRFIQEIRADCLALSLIVQRSRRSAPVLMRSIFKHTLDLAVADMNADVPFYAVAHPPMYYRWQIMMIYAKYRGWLHNAWTLVDLLPRTKKAFKILAFYHNNYSIYSFLQYYLSRIFVSLPPY